MYLDLDLNIEKKHEEIDFFFVLKINKILFVNVLGLEAFIVIFVSVIFNVTITSGSSSLLVENFEALIFF